ncbi:MAG: cell division protein ZapE [Hirschia sp.]|nr:cell division protein ZapE [Hirschia sp.]MBF17634.1 cell division protein ZapE [Hirschia sp.]
MGKLETTYQKKLADGDIAADGAQAEAVKRLDALAVALEETRPGWFSKPDPPKGLYLWGGVGRGKSMLMDLFFVNAPVDRKIRTHFHVFMQETHAFIAEWRKLDQRERRKHPAHVKGAGDDPIQPAAKRVADKARLLCFDEFFVTNIADAMILGRFFEALWSHGVVVMATSNRHPDDLYRNGVNRQLFTPFIARIKDHCDIMELKSEKDYRLDRLTAAPVYYAPLNAESDTAMDAAWKRLTGGDKEHAETLSFLGRTLTANRTAAGCARFSFSELCDRPLGPPDFLAIARQFHTVFIDHTPVLSPANRNAAIRFTTLIDALYEAKVKLVMSAQAEPAQLYPEGDGAFEFERTASRLFEMRSRDYLAAEREEVEVE